MLLPCKKIQARTCCSPPRRCRAAYTTRPCSCTHRIDLQRAHFKHERLSSLCCSHLAVRAFISSRRLMQRAVKARRDSKTEQQTHADTRVAPTLHVPSPKKFTATWSAPSSCSTSCSGAYLSQISALAAQSTTSYRLATAYTGSSALHKETSSNTCPLPEYVSANYMCTERCYEGLFAFFQKGQVRTRR